MRTLLSWPNNIDLYTYKSTSKLEIPLYTGQPAGSQWCPLQRVSTVQTDTHHYPPTFWFHSLGWYIGILHELKGNHHIVDLWGGKGRGTSHGNNLPALEYATHDIVHGPTCSHPSGAHISEHKRKHPCVWNLHRFTTYVHSCTYVYIHMCVQTCTHARLHTHCTVSSISYGSNVTLAR